jgi:hypothetical protein
MGDRRVFYRVVVARPERKTALGRPRHSWEFNNKIDIQEVGWGGMDWIGLSQDRERCCELLNSVMNLHVA